MATELNRVSGSLTDIYEKFLAIAENQFGTNSGNTDYLRSGFMAYVTECMSLIMRDSAIHKTMLYNESFLNTAVIPKSIYNWAKMFNIDVTTATPASADIMITINTNDLDTMLSKRTANSPSMVKYGTDVTTLGENKNVFVIDRTNQIIANGFYFALEKSIIIYKNESTSNSYIVKTCSTEGQATTSFGDEGSKILKTVITSNGSNKYLSFIVTAYQYKINKIEKQITSSSFVDTRVHRFNYDEQLAGLRLQYKKNNKTEYIDLKFNNAGNIENKYGIYNIIDDGEIELRFNSGNFLPSVGGTLILELYTTKGSAGNANFTGDAVLQLSDEDYRSLAIVATFSNNSSSGGVDAPSLSKIKQNIISEISTRDVIVTESDLNKYFATLQILFESVNDGKIEFVKKRADIIKRIFNAYVLLRDGIAADGESIAETNYRSKVIPTNTVDVTMPITTNMSKPFGSLVTEQLNGTSVSYNYVPSELISNKDYYLIPFYMRVTMDPIKKVKYIYNMTDASTSLEYESVESTSGRIISPSSVSVVRSTEGINISNRYTFTFNITSDFNMSEVYGDNPVDLRLYKSKNIYTTVHIPLNDAPNDEECGFQIISENADESNVYNNYFVISVPVDKNEFIFENYDDYGTFINIRSNEVTAKLSEDIYVGLALNASIDGGNLSISFKSGDKLSLFRNLDTIMSSDIVVNKKQYVETVQKEVTTGEGESATTETVTEEVTKDYITSITIREVPVVHTSFFKNEINQTKFIRQLFTYIDMLRNNMNKLETNTTFNLKFMNTHGYSQNYSTINTNINIDMTIYLKNNGTGIEQEIRDYVRVLIDKANEDKALRISQIIALTSIAYSQYIDHIDFEGLNGTFDQYIDLLDSSSSIVPEYFNLDTEKLDNIKFVTL